MNKHEYEGGPAFPTQTVERIEGAAQSFDIPGMTLRDYLAAHAPPDPQKWFKPVGPQHPLMPPLEPPKEIADDAERRLLASWRSDPCFDIRPAGCSPDGLKWVARWEEYWKAILKWEAGKSRALFIQWPYAWADAVLEEQRGLQGK